MSDIPPDPQELVTTGAGNDVLEVTRALLALARDKDLNVNSFQVLMDMQDRAEARQQKRAFTEAFYRLEASLPRIRKNGVVEYPVDKNKPDGPKRKAFKFARWEDVDAAIRPLLREHGFTLSFNTAPRIGDGGGVMVTGKLTHREGHEEVASMGLPLDTSGGKSNLQGYASSTSFGSRYCAKMLLNLVFEGEDDDGVKGGMAFLSDEQVFELQDLLRVTATDEEVFLRAMGFDAHEVHELEVRDFPRLKNALLAKQARQAKPA